MAKHQVYDEATQAAAENGEVVLDGPDGVAVSMTPDAALETSRRLEEAAIEAIGQALIASLPPDRPK